MYMDAFVDYYSQVLTNEGMLATRDFTKSDFSTEFEGWSLNITYTNLMTSFIELKQTNIALINKRNNEKRTKEEYTNNALIAIYDN